MADGNKGQSLAGKVAVVTGASSGIGMAIAIRLASEGAAVAIGARRVERLESVKKEIENAGGKAITVKTDVTKRQEVKDLVRKAEETLGPVDILVNNAGVMYLTPMKNLLEDQWEQTVDVNCKGTLNGIGAVLPGMVDRKKGHIVNISSNAGKVSFSNLAVYTGSKYFIEGMAASMRKELAPLGIKVTNIQPGDVASEIFNKSTDPEGITSYPPPEDSMQADDIARAVVYAVTQPQGVAVNEILVEPTTLPYV